MQKKPPLMFFLIGIPLFIAMFLTAGSYMTLYKVSFIGKAGIKTTVAAKTELSAPAKILTFPMVVLRIVLKDKASSIILTYLVWFSFFFVPIFALKGNFEDIIISEREKTRVRDEQKASHFYNIHRQKMKE